MTVTLLQGDCLTVLQTLPDKSVQCCVTSPPYYGLRDYGVEGQIGLEETPDAYVAKLVAVFREVRRVLRDDGTLWLNLGDSYIGGKGKSGSRGADIQEDRFAKGTTLNRGYQTMGEHGITKPTDDRKMLKQFGIKPKDLIGIPWMVAFALRADGWYLRSDIIWHKPNPMPESVKDRCTKAHEYIFLLAKSQKYYYDADGIAEPSIHAGEIITNTADGKNMQMGKFSQTRTGFIGEVEVKPTRNRRSVWTVTTKPFKGAHFATFPPDLIEPCVLAGSAVGDTVLDPFNGAGTTGLVAIKHGRSYIGIELNPAYIEMTHKRFAQAQPRLEME